MPIERFIWTEHAEQRLAERGLTRVDVERAIREGHDARRINTGDADWRVHGIRPDEREFEVVYDHPIGGDRTAARIVSAWPLRKPRRS
jgi:hypothetical protein